MGLTVATVPHPNQIAWEGEFLGLKARVYDLTFDSSYLTTGEVLTAKELGWDQIHGIIPLTLATNAAGTAAYSVQARPSTKRDSVAVQLYSTATTVVAAPEVVSGVDASTYTVRVIALGM